VPTWCVAPLEMNEWNSLGARVQSAYRLHCRKSPTRDLLVFLCKAAVSAMKPCSRSRGITPLIPKLTLDRLEWSASRPLYSLGKRCRCPSNRRRCGPQICTGEKTIPLPEFEPRIRPTSSNVPYLVTCTGQEK